MKYIDADKLIAEIERRIAAYQKNFDKADNKIAKLSTDGRIASLKGILPFITSLQQEQQEEVECEDLEEAAEHYADYNSRRWQEDGDIYYDHSKIKDAFLAGAEWMEEQEQPDNEDIDKVAQELYEHLYELKRRNNVPTNLYDKQEIIDLWKAGIVYGRSHPKHEQPDVELEKEIERYLLDYAGLFIHADSKTVVQALASHFYELGLKARKKE